MESRATVWACLEGSSDNNFIVNEGFEPSAFALTMPKRSMLPRVIFFVVMAFVLGWAMDFSTRHSQAGKPAGLWWGFVHGALMPTAMPSLLAGRDVAIYASNNTGVGYKLGYTMGVNACGLLFFGLLFWRPSGRKPKLPQ